MADGRAARERLLEVRDLSAGYGAVPTIVDVSLDVGKAEVVSVLGPNGAGKSTLMKALLGMLRIHAGEVVFAGEDITRMAADSLARRGVAYVPQNRDVFDALSVRENLNMGGYLLPLRQVQQRIEEVIEVFPALRGLLRRQAATLSGGERKMLAVGRVLMMRPLLLVLDEPTANLSPELSATLLQSHVKRLANSGTAVLLVEQKAEAAMEISDWTYVIVSGRMRLAGRPEDLRSRADFAQVYLGAKVSENPVS